MSPTSHINAARRVADKAKRDEFQQLLSKLDPEYVTKLRYDCMRLANAAHPSGDPYVAVREAERTFREAVRFLFAGKTATSPPAKPPADTKIYSRSDPPNKERDALRALGRKLVLKIGREATIKLLQETTKCAGLLGVLPHQYPELRAAFEAALKVARHDPGITR
jgi:hypothetical protein